ncbi:RNA-directed DNA polymerase [Nitrosomonas sp. Nm51]|uniref:reverse transcriptase N-terminal domain-containing protein n=1 Tax=Nitrosomonas sp. Nm51 TaxID=133720 RepID=UPI0008D21004|nr:reverse transcriptase N-terminal domain-containing protein [Nitrosomonas sp. Nm51]SER87617.1 RNA-directed DNA polymerase [Nitrosomonas sp. Nm51]
MTVIAVGDQSLSAGTGELSAVENVWDQIDWDQVSRAVLRLQARIAKATEVGRWNKVKALLSPPVGL